MDTSDLVKRYGTVPDHIQREVDEVWSTLQEQADYVISAKALANFSVDEDMTLLYGKTHRGLIVNLKPDYVVSERDSWIPNNISGQSTVQIWEVHSCVSGRYKLFNRHIRCVYRK